MVIIYYSLLRKLTYVVSELEELIYFSTKKKKKKTVVYNIRFLDTVHGLKIFFHSTTI